MPEKLNETLVYDIDIIAEIDADKEQDVFIQELKISIDLRSVNLDDSLLLELKLVEAKWKSQAEDTEWIQSQLEGKSFFVTAFPWGELLKIEGWELLPADPHLDTLDIILPLLFPNPPARESQQWNYRVLPWRYWGGIPDDYLRLNQKIIANWTKESEMVWAYQGEWIANTRLERILEGKVEGKIEKSGVWIDSHEWEWEREILFPEMQSQHFKGKLQRHREVNEEKHKK